MAQDVFPDHLEAPDSRICKRLALRCDAEHRVVHDSSLALYAPDCGFLRADLESVAKRPSAGRLRGRRSDGRDYFYIGLPGPVFCLAKQGATDAELTDD